MTYAYRFFTYIANTLQREAAVTPEEFRVSLTQLNEKELRYKQCPQASLHSMPASTRAHPYEAEFKAVFPLPPGGSGITLGRQNRFAIVPLHSHDYVEMNYVYTGNNLCFTSDGTDYTALVRKEIGLEYDNEKYNRYDPEKAAEYKAKAIEELTAKGVTFPVTVDYYISGASDVAAQTAKVLENVFAEGLGSDYVVLKTNTYISSLANEVRKPRKASIFINGWGADFADPINFLGQETYNDPQAYYSNAYSMCNQNDDPDLIAAYQEFTDLVVKAKAITNDMDARYAAFAKAEACMLNHALVIPCSYEVGWELTKINNYTKVYSMYGMQAYRYVDWETSETPYTTEEMNANAAAYNAE